MGVQDSPVIRIGKTGEVQDIAEYEDHHLINAFKHDIDKAVITVGWMIKNTYDFDPRCITRVSHIIYFCNTKVVVGMAKEIARRHLTINKEISNPWAYIRKCNWMVRYQYAICADNMFDDMLFPYGIASRDPMTITTSNDK